MYGPSTLSHADVVIVKYGNAESICAGEQKVYKMEDLKI